MKKVAVGSLAIASMVLLSSCGLSTPEKTMPRADDLMMKEGEMEQGDAMMEVKGDVMMKKDEVMMKKDDAMMKKDEVMEKAPEAMMKKDDAMMKKEGEYTAYSAASVDAALASGKKVALFFHAPWCPSCKALDGTLQGETVPSDVAVFKVDFDTSSELKKKYGVTSQHTIVTLDANKNKVKLDKGAKNLSDITKLF
jgi:thiol-disulfide isomerase/thioredoxin